MEYRRFIIQSRPSIEEARKNVNLDGEPYDPDDTSQCSEWAFAIALNRYKIGDNVSEEELFEAIAEAKMQQTLDKLVEIGYVDCVWDHESGEPVYTITQKGKHHVENDLMP